MFLNPIIRRNPKLIQACVQLHQEGKIPANSYALDLDTIRKNARHIAQIAGNNGLAVFAMTKQIGRNPDVLQAIKQEGISSCVCVDMNDARPVHASGLEIGHLGHLVQVPKFECAAALSMHPQYFTVFSLDKAKEISDALPKGQRQKILLRIYDQNSKFYRGHEGGIPAEDVMSAIEKIQAMQGLEFAGLTIFPTQLFDLEQKHLVHTSNFKTLMDTAKRVQDALGHKIEINAPGTTSSMFFEQLVREGVTQVEPGHGLTGTCPQHAFDDLVELPAMAYVSEVSHRYAGQDYCFGGGFYIDPIFGSYDVKVCVGHTPDQALNQLISCEIPKPESIDYYGMLQTQSNQSVQAGDTVVFGFRAQAFVTRAYVVAIEGVQSDHPSVNGIYLSNGQKAGWPTW